MAKLWMVTYPNSRNEGQDREFVTTKREGDGYARLVDIPTDKVGLMRWLNLNCT